MNAQWSLTSVRFAHLSMPKPGEHHNGDAVLVRQGDPGHALYAVIDGLGHGQAAAEASHAAIETLETLALDTPLQQTMQLLHAKLKETRGAAATLCRVDHGRIEACAVGNVQLLSVNCAVPLVLSAGVLGHQVRKFRICDGQLQSGARLALLSDGISTKFRLEELRNASPREACKLVMDRHRRGDDDATVLIADL